MPRKKRWDENDLFGAPPEGMLGFERMLWGKGYSVIAGVDEAGRGPLAGPVTAAAVVLDESFDIEGIDDSKKLAELVRERLFERICGDACSYAVAHSGPREIERTDILKATKAAMIRALAGLSEPPDYVLVDGNQRLDIPNRQYTLVKGDGRSASIAAASILAKVARDNYMIELHDKWPQYNFKSNKGYGTAEHLAVLKKYGPCPEHRATFAGVKEHLENDEG